ncbi:PAP2 superfamily domain-containing protein [Phthorimaea operculella]|nr:PAP2 superfamily domain-containing protein [Phthorimaea operculella]
MMDQVYALGVSIIEVIQHWFEDYDGYFEFVNDVANPNHTLEYLFPFISIFDSVFSAQLVLCMAFGSWVNTVMKWWLLEHRPYWWVRETDFYEGYERPIIRQTHQTCETGPGSPSGHSESAAMLLVLTICWLSHYMTDRKLQYITWWKYIWYPLCGFTLGSVMLARLYIGTHFPHQVLFGALLGGFLAPFLCIYVLDPFIWQYGYHAAKWFPSPVSMHLRVRPLHLAIRLPRSQVSQVDGILALPVGCGFLAPFLCIYVLDPFIWQYGYHAAKSVKWTVFWHFASAVTTVLIGVVTYFSMTWCGFDPQWTIKLAFKWCKDPANIHVSTTPMYALVYSTGHLIGWSLSVTPSVSKYRHYTKTRSLLIAAFTTGFLMYCYHIAKNNINKECTMCFYLTLFILSAVRVPLILRLPPYLAMWPYEQIDSPKKQLYSKQKHLKTN